MYCEYVVLDFEFSGFVFDFEFFGFVFNFEFFLVGILNFLGKKNPEFKIKKKKKNYSCVSKTQLKEALAAFLKCSQNYTYSRVLNAAQSESIAAFFYKTQL